MAESFDKWLIAKEHFDGSYDDFVKWLKTPDDARDLVDPTTHQGHQQNTDLVKALSDANVKISSLEKRLASVEAALKMATSQTRVR